MNESQAGLGIHQVKGMHKAVLQELLNEIWFLISPMSCREILIFYFIQEATLKLLGNEKEEIESETWEYIN